MLSHQISLSIPDSHRDSFHINRNQYNSRALRIIALMTIGISFVLILQYQFLSRIPKSEIWYIIYILTFLVLAGTGILYFGLSFISLSPLKRYALDVFYILLLGHILAFLTWIDLHYEWDLSAFLIALILLSTAVWIDIVLFGIISSLMFISLIAGLSLIENAVYLTPERLINLAVYLVVGWFIMIDINALKLKNFISYMKLEIYSLEMEKNSLHDVLTGLKNRRYLESAFETIASISMRHNKPFSLIILDIDYFKRVNDTYGHSAGDQVLSIFGSLLLESVRKSDVAVRFGGEEFVLLLTDSDRTESLILTERIRQSIENHSFPGIKDKVTASMGISDSREGENLEELLSIADGRLYKAKNAGRNCIIND